MDEIVSTSKPPRLPKSAPKVRLSIVAGPGAGQSVDLTRCVTIIGSRAGCKLQLKSSRISPLHCAIVNTGEEVFVRDLVSHTGTFLNDLPAVVERIEDGDTVRIGEWELRVQITAYTLDTLSDLPHVTLEPEPTAVGVEVNGSGSLVRISRPVGVLGRRPGCDVKIDNRQISRVHLLLFTYRGQPVFFDLLSNNGVMLEGKRTVFSPLHSGDVLMLGPQRIRMILPGVARRRPSPDGSSSGSSGMPAAGGSSGGVTAGHGSSTVAPAILEGTGEGTVIPVEDDESDRIDIRTAESEGR